MADSGGSSSISIRDDGEKTIALVSSDNARFEVREAAALLSQTVRRRMIIINDEARRRGNNANRDGIPLPEIDGKTLSMVLAYCNKHAADDRHRPPPAKQGEEELERFDREFMLVNKGTFCDLLNAAHYLKIQGLMDLTGQTLSDMIAQPEKFYYLTLSSQTS